MNQAKKKRSFPYVTVILLVTVALVVIVLGHCLLDAFGVYGMTRAGKSQSITLSENHLDVYRYHVAQNQLYYQYMYVQYGLAQDPTGGLISALNWTAADFISYMLPMTVGSGDYDESAYEYGKQYLTYCEGAKAAGLYDEYKTKVAPDIDEYVNGLKDMAKTSNITFHSFLTDYMGNGVSEKDVRVAMEYYYIGAEYAEKLTDDYAEKARGQEETYRDENKSAFYTSSYTSYKLVSNDLYEKAKACKTLDEIKTMVIDYYLDDMKKFDDNYKTKITDKNVATDATKEQTKADVRTTLLAKAGVGTYTEVFKESDSDAYKKAAYEIVKAIDSLVSAQTGKMTESSAAWTDLNPKKADGTADTEAAGKLTDLQKWLFADGRAVGDYTVIKTETSSTSSDGKTTTNTSYTWYLVEEAMVLDEELTKNAHYIVLADDGKDVENGLTAVKKGELMHKALSDTPVEKRAEKFQELVKQYAPGYSNELVEYISYKDMEESYPDLAKWLYDEKRKEGDINEPILVKNDTTDKNKVTGSIVAVFMGENDETWKVNARQAIAGEKLNEWFENAVKEYGVKMDYDFTETTTAAQ